MAFYAYIEHKRNQYRSIPSQTTLVFETIKINDGNGYNNSDGILTAPRTGVYAFHWSVMVDYYSWTSVELVVNGTPIGCAAIETQGVHDFGTGSGLVITHVNKGDRVSLRMHEPMLGWIKSSDQGSTSFSGWLLQP